MSEGSKDQIPEQEITTPDEALRQIDDWFRSVSSKEGNALQRDGFLASKTAAEQQISRKGRHNLSLTEEGWRRWIAGERPPEEEKITQ